MHDPPPDYFYYADGPGPCDSCCCTGGLTPTRWEPKEHTPKQQGSAHYQQGSIQPIEFILANDLGFCEGNVVKYVTRYPHKGTPKEDLVKARHYLDILIARLDTEEINDDA
jgi:hypothetical protein